ncbi:protein FAM167A-like [Diadema antillarum]|uniref:protein FAM167A-like n=1 Tax=Diadema antillarum TaxID=105358 RepID=UPI003A8A195A
MNLRTLSRQANMSAPQILINGTVALPDASTRPKFLISHELQPINEDEEVAGLNELKKITTRLRLSTRRPSIMQWRENLSNFQENVGLLARSTSRSGTELPVDEPDMDTNSDERYDSDDSADDQDRRKKIDDAIEWIKKELMDMKSQDHQLAMQLMKLRAEIHELKLQKTSDEHKELIEDARYSIVEESEELKSALFDLPLNNNMYSLGGVDDPRLKDIGVTRMNLNRRRFSLR